MTQKYGRVVTCIIFFFVLWTMTDAEQTKYSEEIEVVLEKAGDNRPELEKVIDHYASSDDTLKYDAALFLIGNMEGHCYATYALQDTLENEYDLNVLDYPDFETLLADLDTLEEQHGTLDFSRKELIYDIDIITAEFLINHIDDAFRAWREHPWAGKLSYDYFREYILPYRGSNEPLEDWRPYFRDEYADIASTMADPADPIEAASIINDDIMSWFSFDRRYYLHPTDQGLSEMLDTKMGRCEDMTNLSIFAMRANGLAVTSDFTPYWANAGNNHAWNAIVTPDGKVIPFMGAESNPGDYKLHYKLAKVYRKMYGLQKDNLIFQERKQEKVPGWLAGKSYIDVTSDYVDVADVSITLDGDIPDSADIAYLCVFNDGGWRAIHWGRIQGGAALFKDMGVGVAYVPALYINKEIEPCGDPFILQDDLKMLKLAVDNAVTISLELSSTTKVKQDNSTDGVMKTYLNTGADYELSYWHDGWQSLGKKTAGEKPLQFDSVPGGGLYRLAADDSKDDERIFTYSDGLQIWW